MPPNIGLPFEIKEGSRKGSRLYITTHNNQKHAFVKDKDQTVKCRRCQAPKFKDNEAKDNWQETRCYARGKIVDGRILLRKDHNHPEESKELNQMFLKTLMKSSVEQQPMLTSRQVFDSTSLTEPTVAAQVNVIF